MRKQSDSSSVCETKLTFRVTQSHSLGLSPMRKQKKHVHTGVHNTITEPLENGICDHQHSEWINKSGMSVHLGQEQVFRVLEEAMQKQA